MFPFPFLFPCGDWLDLWCGRTAHLGRIKSWSGPSLLTLVIVWFQFLLLDSSRSCGQQDRPDCLLRWLAVGSLAMPGLSYRSNTNKIDKCRFSIPSSVQIRFFFVCLCGSSVPAFVSSPANTELGERPTHEGIAESSPHSSKDCVPYGPESFVSWFKVNFCVLFCFVVDADFIWYREAIADGTEEPKRADKNSFFKFFQENFECLYPVVESKIAALLKEFKSVVDDAGSGHLPASKVDAHKRAVTNKLHFRDWLSGAVWTIIVVLKTMMVSAAAAAAASSAGNILVVCI